MGLYKKLLSKKKNDELIPFEELSIRDFEKLVIVEGKTEKQIVELFDVTLEEVEEKRKLMNIRNKSIDLLFKNRGELVKKLNKQAKNDLFKEENLSQIAIAITHFAFRNGPVEDMHASSNNQLSDENMKILNKFMVNRLAYVFELIMNEKWAEFAFLIDSHKFFGREWDEALPDDGGNRELMEEQLKGFLYE